MDARVGLQWFPTKRESSSTTVTIQAYTSERALADVPNGDTLDKLEGCPGTISWSIGGTSTGGCGQVVSRTLPGPGTYSVTATVIDPITSEPITWTRTVVIDPVMSALVSVDGDTFTAGVSGGQGTILAAHWVFSDATTADGITVTKPGATGSVTVVDGAGNKATTSF